MEESGIRQLRKFARTLSKHQQGNVAWNVHRISTGSLDVTNSKIKLLQQQAYGNRDLEFFMLKLLVLHSAQNAFVE